MDFIDNNFIQNNLIDKNFAYKINQIQQCFESYKDNKNFSGVALIKQGKDELFHFCAGYENRMYKIKNELSTSYDTASITKLFTAAGIVLLENKGLLSFEDKIHSILDLQNTKIPKDIFHNFG